MSAIGEHYDRRAAGVSIFKEKLIDKCDPCELKSNLKTKTTLS